MEKWDDLRILVLLQLVLGVQNYLIRSKKRIDNILLRTFSLYVYAIYGRFW